jgi:putative nucleotidyltransferase with HDIG domain
MDTLVQELRNRLNDSSLELPLLPEVAQKVIAMTSDENCNAAQLSAIIHRDQALASNVLRITNSANYAGNYKIVSLQQAISRLGLNLLREITLAASVQNSVFNVPGHEKTIKHLWEHSLGCSSFSKEIARSRRRNVESAYLCGLLHNIGKPLTLKHLHETTKKLSIRLTEEEIFKILAEEHHIVGSRMAIEWELPEQVSMTINYYERFDECENFEDEVMTVALAHMCTDELLSPDTITQEAISQHDVVDALNLYPDDVNAIFDKKEKILELISSMG